MELPTNAKVECIDGHFGKTTHIVLNPHNNEITHIVVKRAKTEEEYLIDVDCVSHSDDKHISLNIDQAAVLSMKHFNETQYIPPGKYDTSDAEKSFGISGHLLMMPYAIPHPANYHRVEVDRLPYGQLAISKGHTVEAADGHIGTVDEFLVNPKDHHISHLIMRHGHFWDEFEVTIPITAIDHIDAGKVQLKIDKAAIKALPTIPVKRFWN